MRPNRQNWIFLPRFPWLAVAAIFLFSTHWHQPAIAAPLEGTSAPGFVLLDTAGHARSLSSFRGKPVVLFFFCGCKWCNQAARTWAMRSRTQTSADGPKTLVVFSGDRREAQQFAAQTGFNMATTTILTDPFAMTAMTLYDAEPCPRVFVLSPSLSITYTNDHGDDNVRRGGIDKMVEQIDAALRSAATPPPAAIAAASATEQASHGGPATLDPLPVDGTVIATTEGIRSATYDFGTVDRTKTKLIEHEFQLKNDTDLAIDVVDVQPSCGCTNAFIDGSQSYPVRVLPGQTIKVETYVDLTDLYPGSVHKSVMLFARGQVSPIGDLEIDGQIQTGT